MSWLRSAVTSSRERKRWLLATWAGAVAFRVALFFSGLVDVIFETADSYEYRWLAQSLLRHQVFGFDGVPKMNRTPGYPAMLALVYGTLGSSQLAVTAVQIALDAAVCAMVVDILARAGVRRAGLLATSLLAATCAFTAAYSYEVMTEAFYTFMLVLGMWMLPRGGVSQLFARENRRRMVIVGCLLGMTTLVRPAFSITIATFGGLVALALLRATGRRAFQLRVLVTGALFGAAVAVMIVPWMARNLTVFRAEYQKPDHSHVTPLGFKTDIPIYRHYYSAPFMKFRKSYEEPFIMEGPNRPPVVARYAYDGEREEVIAAFSTLAAELAASDEKPIERSTLAAFEAIADKRLAASPRLHVTPALTRAGKFWIAPRVSVLFLGKHGGSVKLSLMLGLVLYNCLYVLPGLLALLLPLPGAKPAWTYARAAVVAHTLLHSLWHPEVQSRYAIPLFPILCMAIGLGVSTVLARGLRPSAYAPRLLLGRLRQRGAREASAS